MVLVICVLRKVITLCLRFVFELRGFLVVVLGCLFVVWWRVHRVLALFLVLNLGGFLLGFVAIILRLGLLGLILGCDCF